MEEDVRQVADGAVCTVAEREELQSEREDERRGARGHHRRHPDPIFSRGALHAASVTLEV
jgi:hypothetical protein